MARRLLLLLAVCGLLSCAAFAAPVPGPNPADAELSRYEFARSYITALGYLKDVDDRWHENKPKKLFANQKDKMILATINELSLDSSDLLIVKHYLLKYMTSPNRLMRKVADIVIVAVSKEIAINHQQKELWQKWYTLNAAGQAAGAKEVAFLKAQYGLELRRKAADKQIIEASILMTKVLIANGHHLNITSQERQKLLDKLDSFGRDEMDWGLKSGQTTLQASIAVIREILEDSIWISVDEK